MYSVAKDLYVYIPTIGSEVWNSQKTIKIIQLYFIKFKQMKKGIFEVYTYFGRVLLRFYIPSDETHHKTKESAYNSALMYEKQGTKCWVRYI